MSSPHLLIITVDTLRADALACFGGSLVETPQMDRLAEMGVCFHAHHACLSETLPSHASLFTGSFPSSNGVVKNGQGQVLRRTSLAEIAREQGYHTTAITSWAGFAKNDCYGFENYHSEHSAAHLENRGDRTLERVEAFIQKTDPNEPQCFWIHLIDPHEPDNPPEPYPETYAGEVAFTDHILGKIFELWDEKFKFDHTLLALTADHGEHLNDHGVERGHGSLWKTNLWVPLIMVAPGRIDAGRRVDETTRHVDILPTILDYMSWPMPYDVDGSSLRGLVEGRDTSRMLVGQGQNLEGFLGRSSVIHYHGHALHFDDKDKLSAVFDLEEDPGETRNLLSSGHQPKYSVEHSKRDARE